MSRAKAHPLLGQSREFAVRPARISSSAHEGMRHPVSSCESLVVRDGGVMQLLVVEGAIVPGAPKDAYPGAGEDADGMGMIAASAASALVDVCCPGGCVSGVVGEAGDGPSQAMVACPAEDDTASLAGGVGARYAPTFSPRMRGEKVNQRQRAAMSEHAGPRRQTCNARNRLSASTRSVLARRPPIHLQARWVHHAAGDPGLARRPPVHLQARWVHHAAGDFGLSQAASQSVVACLEHALDSDGPDDGPAMHEPWGACGWHSRTTAWTILPAGTARSTALRKRVNS
jgi:hypothetical protein